MSTKSFQNKSISRRSSFVCCFPLREFVDEAPILVSGWALFWPTGTARIRLLSRPSAYWVNVSAYKLGVIGGPARRVDSLPLPSPPFILRSLSSHCQRQGNADGGEDGEKHHQRTWRQAQKISDDGLCTYIRLCRVCFHHRGICLQSQKIKCNSRLLFNFEYLEEPCVVVC